MSDVAELIIEVLTHGTKESIQELKDIAAAGRVAEDQTMSLVGALKTLASAWAVEKMSEALVELAQMGARYEMLGATLGVMANNAGIYSNQMVGIQENMMKTGIAALEARRDLQLMAAAHVDLSRATELARVAQDAATLAGINSSVAFDNLVRGIATGESRIIRHMGIMVNFKSAIVEWANAHGRAVSSLTTTELAQIRLDSALEEGRKRTGVYEAAMTTAGKQILSMQRYTDNLKVSIGETFNAATNELIFSVVNAMSDAKNWMDQWEASGEKAVFASKLRVDMQELVSSIKSVTVFLWNHRDALEAVAIIYGSFKFAQYAEGIVKTGLALYGASLQGQALKMNEVKGEIAVAEAKLADVAATIALNESMIAANGTRFRSNAWLELDIQLQASDTIATEALAAAKARLAAAESGGVKAASMAGTTISALGGPLTILITLLAAASVAWVMFKDKEKKASEENLQSLRDLVNKKQQEIMRAEEILWLLEHGRKKEADKVAGYTEDPQIAAREAELQLTKNQMVSEEKLAELRLASAEELKIVNDDSELSASKELWRQEELKTKAEELAYVIENSHTHSRQLADINEKIEEKRIEQAKNVKDITEDGNNKDSWYRNFVISTEKKILDEKIKSLTLGKAITEEMKAQALYTENMAKIEEHSRVTGKKKEGPSSAAVENARIVAAAYRDQQIATAQVIEVEKRYEDEEKHRIATIDKILEKTKQMKKETDEFGLSDEERAKIELRGLEYLGAGYEYLKGLMEDYYRTKRAHEEGARIDRDAESLNKRRTEEQDQLSHLEKLKVSGRLLPGVYEQAWLDIMNRGTSATAFMVQTADNAFGKMSDSFANFVVTGKMSFKDLIRSIMADTARLASSKAFQQLFMMAAKAYLGSGSSWDGTGNGSQEGYDAMFEGHAGGGTVMGGRPIVVGEKGPELYIPQGAGSISPNGSFSGGSPIIQNFVDVRIDGNGSVTSKVQGRGVGDSLAREMDAFMRGWVLRESRPDGVLNPIQRS